MRARVGLVFALVLLVLTSCARNEAGQTPTNPPVSEVTSPSDTLLEYGRQGGLKGADDHLVVKRDGSYTLTRRNQQDVTGTLTQEQLAGLQQALAASNFKSIPHVNKGGTIADGYTYRVVYDGYEVLAEDGAIPPALKNVITTLNAVLSS
jgi:hypothetical protein